MKFPFYLLILLLPTQLGRHFWPDFSFIQGIRVDYLSPTVYLTDILIILLFLTWALAEFKIKNSPFDKKLAQGKQLRIQKVFIYSIVVFIGIVVAGIYFSSSPLAGLYGLVKLFEFSFFGFYVARIVTSSRQIKTIMLLLLAGVFFESFLAILQFLNQSSLGGIFWFLGERTFNGQTLGIAQAVVNGELIPRPYGTFSHPNVLAGFLVVAIALIIPVLKKRMFIATTIISIGSIALLLTMSRVAILIWLLILLFFSRKRSIIYYLLSIILIISIFYFSPLSPRFTNFSLTNESFTRREELVISAVEMIKSQPLVGVGLNNFLVNLPKFQETKNIILYLQPVHNIYLLIAAETGIIGLGFFLWFIKKTYQKIKSQKSKVKRPLFIALAVILILGLFDHYWLTLQQGQLLFTLVLGLSWAKVRG